MKEIATPKRGTTGRGDLAKSVRTEKSPGTTSPRHDRAKRARNRRKGGGRHRRGLGRS